MSIARDATAYICNKDDLITWDGSCITWAYLSSQGQNLAKPCHGQCGPWDEIKAEPQTRSVWSWRVLDLDSRMISRFSPIVSPLILQQSPWTVWFAVPCIEAYTRRFWGQYFWSRGLGCFQHTYHWKGYAGICATGRIVALLPPWI